MNRVRETSRTRIGLGGSKRKADISPKKIETKKRSALGDLTNAKKSAAVGDKVGAKELKQEKPSMIPTINLYPESKESRVTRARSKSLKGNEEPMKLVERNNGVEKRVVPEPAKALKEVGSKFAAVPKRGKSLTKKSDGKDNVKKENVPSVGISAVPEPSRVLKEVSSKFGTLPKRGKSLSKKSDSKDNIKKENIPLPSFSISEEESMYQTAYSTPVLEHLKDGKTESVEELQNKKNEELTEQLKSRLPQGVVDFDEEAGNDPFQVGLYASDIFAYYKRRELRLPIKKYLDKQVELNKNMRCILVDWMVEVQESFEMNHETLYLAVKLVDLYLGRVLVKRDKLQLVGTTALYIAAKYDERCPPVIDDFCYICDDAYSQKEVIQMEEKMLKALKFDIGVPLSYRFLRRYARCAKLDMETLTLARFILEMSLMEYDFIDALDSMMGAAALLLALKMVKVENPWTPTLQYYSTYATEDLFDLTHRLYDFMRKPQAHLKTIRSKYSHTVFYGVAKIALPEELKL